MKIPWQVVSELEIEIILIVRTDTSHGDYPSTNQMDWSMDILITLDAKLIKVELCIAKVKKGFKES